MFMHVAEDIKLDQRIPVQDLLMLHSRILSRILRLSMHIVLLTKAVEEDEGVFHVC
jgi:hypothetical protein